MERESGRIDGKKDVLGCAMFRFAVPDGSLYIPAGERHYQQFNQPQWFRIR
jgi:hypothetical protein